MGQSRIKDYPYLVSSSQFTWWPGYMPTKRIREVIFGLAEERVLPVLILKGDASVPGLKPSETPDEMTDYLNRWAEAWNQKDADRLIGFYDDPYTAYYEDGRPWKQLSGTDLYSQYKELFNESPSARLEVFPPLCLVNPQSPDTLLMLFKQRYQADSNSDDGVKVFFLKNRGTPEKHEWKIYSKLWVGPGLEKSGD